MLLKGKTAFISGSNGGIGKSILSTFAKEGANIFAHARKPSSAHTDFCKELEQLHSVHIYPVYFDAENYSEIKDCIKQISPISNTIDILVNNLGVVSNPRSFQMTTVEDMKKEFDINFFSQMYLTQYISRFMIRQKSGSIINISSCAGLDGNAGVLQYVSSKSALIGATKRLAIELGSYNIRVNCIAPGLTNTKMSRLMTPDLEEQLLSHQIFKRKAEPAEIADSVLFFASDLSRFVTGQTLRVDGGMLN